MGAMKLLSCSNASDRSATHRANIIIIMADDMGFSDLGCYGSAINTPNLNQLAREGLRFTQFYNCALCSPTRAALLTGLYPHKTGMGDLVNTKGQKRAPAYQGYLNDRCLTIAEALEPAGYQCFLSGKWHVGEHRPHWPLDRGFEEYYGLISGASNYFTPKIDPKNRVRMIAENNTSLENFAEDFYFTDAISDRAVKMLEQSQNSDRPFFLYVSYTAPHWPLHALPEDIQKYQGKFSQGWDAIREQRTQRLIAEELIDKNWQLSQRDPRLELWENIEHKEWEDMRMAVYAAQIDRMDRGIGKILSTVTKIGAQSNTLAIFLSDNGAESSNLAGNNPNMMPGSKETYMSYGIGWANVSNTPFRRYKKEVYEGGISTPFIARWPGVILPDRITHQVGHAIDLMPTCLDIAGVPYPQQIENRRLSSLDGKSLLPILQGKSREGHEFLYWECRGNRAIRQGQWKLLFDGNLKEWELYNLEADRTETQNLASDRPEIVTKMLEEWIRWAAEINAIGD